MQTIAKTPFYEMSFDEDKNRCFVKIIGFWRSPEVVPDYLNDIGKMLKATRRNFTVVVDTSKMPVHPGDVQRLHESAQTMTLKAGVLKVAHLLSQSAIAEFMVDKMAGNTQLPHDQFRNLAEAEAWLDAGE